MNLDEFLGHTSHIRGNTSKILNWRKKQPPQIDTWLHTKSNIVALWRHGWPRIVELDRDGEKRSEVWGGHFNCLEHEDVLRRQYKRADDGARIAPPVVCPMCLLLEYLRGMVRAEKLSWLEPIFRFEGDDPKAQQTFTAAGLFNGFGGDLSGPEIADMRKAGVRRDEAWKQNSMAKCSYVFSIVDNDEPDKGVQTAVETTALGDAVKRVIRDQIVALGASDGHPLRNPYAIRWQYNEKEPRFDEKYRALAMPRLAISDEVRDLICDTDAPDLSSITGRGNVASLRSAMESHALIDLPFDRLFAPSESGAQAPSPAAPRALAKARPAPTLPVPIAKPAAPPPMRRKPPLTKGARTSPVYPPGTPTLPCDACKVVMGASEAICWNCGAQYEVDPPDDIDETARAKPTADRQPGDDDLDEIGF